MKRMKAIVPFACIALAALITFAGCATGAASNGATSGGAASPDTAAVAAAKLAADINAVKPGSAKVNGDTVTVTGKVELKAALTVPEGVTLDLTADGAALELRDGAALTVNGAVNARGHGDHGSGWVEGSLRVEDGATAIDGTGTLCLASKGRLLSIGSDRGRRTLTLDGVTLVGLPDNDSPLVGISENGELVLKSGAITGNTCSSDNWASGGGVEVWHGTFTMEGGGISGNSVSGKDGSSGGGVQVNEGGTFTMSGGTITGNTATGGNNAKSAGGGVALYNKGTNFTMKGGVISANACTGGKNALGGGLFVERSVFIMEGGTIYGNAGSLPAGTDAILANKAQDGVSVYVNDAAAKWGMSGTYQGGESQIGGNEIVRSDPRRGRGTNDTLIAVPAQ